MERKLVFEQFDNLDAFARSLTREPNAVFKGMEHHSQRKDDPSFFGTKTYEEALNLYRNGWSEKAEEIRKEFVRFERAQERDVSYQKSRPSSSVVGFAPHVPNAILGLPNSMIYTDRQPMKAKVVRIIFNLGMNCNTAASDIMNAGLTVLKIANSLERKGLRVRVDVTPKLSREGNEDTCALVCVKDWRQPIDIKKVAFPIAHPSMFRRLGFRWLETTPNLSNRGYVGGYGQSYEKPEQAKEVLKRAGVLGDTDYFINTKIAKDNGFDPERVADAIGIKH